jgi:hypothetical protein
MLAKAVPVCDLNSVRATQNAAALALEAAMEDGSDWQRKKGSLDPNACIHPSIFI